MPPPVTVGKTPVIIDEWERYCSDMKHVTEVRICKILSEGHCKSTPDVERFSMAVMGSIYITSTD